MRNWLKIIIVLLAISPLWLTIVAFGGQTPSAEWKDAINQKLLDLQDRKVQIVDFYSSAEVPTEADLKKPFRIEVASLKPRGVSKIGVKFEDELGRLQKLIWLRARVDLQSKTAVATRPMTRGDIVTANDIEYVWKSVRDHRSSAPREIAGRQIKSDLKVGEVFARAKLQMPIVIKKGDRVRVTVVGDGVRLTMVAVAEENGQAGETIRLMNPNSRKKVFATVTGTQKAEVKL